MLDLNSLFLLTRYKTSLQFSLINDCASIANDCVVSSMIVFDTACLHCRWTGVGAITTVCAPCPPHARKTSESPKKALQNSGAEGMVQNQYLWEVFAP